MINLAIQKVAPAAAKNFHSEAFGEDAAEILSGRHWNNKQGVALLLAHMHHETQGFTKFEEVMRYSAKRLTQVWPSRFPTLAAAQPYANNPQALAVKVYGGRMGNASHPSTDGWDFRGSGGLQHTGKSEHLRVLDATGVTSQQLRSPVQAVLIFKAAVSYIEHRKVGASLSAGQVDISCKLINGGYIGLEDRKVLYRRYHAVITGGAVPKERTRQETKRVVAKQATASVGTGTGTSGSSATVQQTGAAKTLPVHSYVYIGGIVIGVALIGFGVWKFFQYRKLKKQLDNEEAELLRAKTGDASHE